MRCQSFYKKLFAFFRDWNYALLSELYRSEVDTITPEYIAKEELYYEKVSKMDMYRKLFLDENIKVLSKLFRQPELESHWCRDSQDDFLYWVDNNIGIEFDTIIKAMAKGYLWEWLLFYALEESERMISLLENINSIKEVHSKYKEWKKEFELHDYSTRREVLSDYGVDAGYVLYRGVVEEKLLRTMFIGMNGGRLSGYTDVIIDLMIENDILLEMQAVYAEHWKNYGTHNSWDKDLLEPKQIQQENKHSYPELKSEQKDYFKDYVYITVTDRRQKMAVDKEQLYHLIFDLWVDIEYEYNTPFSKRLWRAIFDELNNYKLLPEGEYPYYKKFVDNVVIYVHNIENNRYFAEALSKVYKSNKIAKLKTSADRDLFNYKKEQFNIDMANYLNNLNAFSTKH